MLVPSSMLGSSSSVVAGVVQYVQPIVVQYTQPIEQTCKKLAMDALKFATGFNNLSNAKKYFTKEHKFEVESISDKKFVIEQSPPSMIETVRGAAGELTIAGAKAIGWGMLGWGGVCKGAVAAGLINPCSTLSFSGASQIFYTGMSTVGSGVMTTTCLAANHVALPAIKLVVNQMLDHPITSVAIGVNAALMYSAYNDFSELGKEASPNTRKISLDIENSEVEIKNVRPFSEKLKLIAKGVGKLALAAGVVFAAT